MFTEVEQYLKTIRAREYDEVQREQEALQESVNLTNEHVRKSINKFSTPLKKMEYEFNVFKEVMCECFSNLYLDSLLIDDVDKYKNSLKESASNYFMETIKDCKNKKDIVSLFENTSPYIKNAMVLAEAISAKKIEDEADEKPIPMKVIFDSEDKKMIDDFEKIQGKKDYGKDIQDRVVKVFKAEEKIGQKRKENVQNIIDDLSKNDEAMTEGAIMKGLNTFSQVPETVFHAIYMNRSKMVITENASANLDEARDTIIAETICIYTLLECGHALGVKTYDVNQRKKLRTDIHLGLHNTPQNREDGVLNEGIIGDIINNVRKKYKQIKDIKYNEKYNWIEARFNKGKYNLEIQIKSDIKLISEDRQNQMIHILNDIQEIDKISKEYISNEYLDMINDKSGDGKQYSKSEFLSKIKLEVVSFNNENFVLWYNGDEVLQILNKHSFVVTIGMHKPKLILFSELSI